MLRRPWPPVYRHPGSGGGGLGPPGGPYHTFFPNIRPHEFSRSPEFYSSPPHKDFYHHKSKGDYYFLAPLYRNVLPPPPPPAPLKPLPRRIMPMPPIDMMRRSNSQPPCTCAVPPRLRSRSLENLNNIIIDSQEDDYPSSSNCRDSVGHRDKENFRRSSMENLLDVNNNLSPAPFFHKAPRKPFSRSDGDGQSNSGRPRFVPVTTLEDAQAVRCAEFHPNGNIYAVGSNSKTLRICAYPKLTDLREDHTTYQPTVLFKRTRHHKGSIYCMAWTPVGDLMATGSNDKTVKLMKFNEETSNLEGQEIELNMHDGTVRDVCFIEDTTNKSSLLISGGAGDCKIYVTDCATGQAFQALSGHSGHVLSLYSWGGAMFISGSHDRTVRFWDLRTRGCTNVLSPITVPGTRQGSPVSALCVDPSGRLMVSGHEDASCVLYDIRGSRPLQTFKPHTADVRSIRFSPSAYYLLTGGYDNKLVLTDLQGDLTMPLPSVVVASHSDKVISARWHPSEFSFLSTSADKTATLWALPPV